MADDKHQTKPPHEPTSQTTAEVRALATFGVPQEQIADYLDIDAKTLRKYYRAELDNSKLAVRARVSAFLVNAATGAALTQDVGATYSDCLRAAMFYGKTQMGLADARAPLTEDEQSNLALVTRIERIIVQPTNTDG
jgi:hypothetical protein